MDTTFRNEVPAQQQQQLNVAKSPLGPWQTRSIPITTYVWICSLVHARAHKSDEFVTSFVDDEAAYCKEEEEIAESTAAELSLSEE